MRIIAVSNNFPTPNFPHKGVFVRNILLEMVRQGTDVDVIAPVSWLANLKTLRNKAKELELDKMDVSWPIMSTIPLTLLGKYKHLGSAFNELSMARAINRSMALYTHYDFCYAHFLPSARAALRKMKHQNIPIFLNFGESSPWLYDELYPKNNWVKEMLSFDGIIVVSKKNKKYLLDREPELESKIRYIPNGVDTIQFKPMDKTECREKLSLPLNEKIAVFSGHFIHRKGPLRVLEALRKLNIKGVFLGSGPDKPMGNEVLHSAPVQNEDIPLWLNAGDVFVLPSLHEGMSNSILEAMACGLPLVVSDSDFNREYLTEECARFVDPMNPEDISRGITECIESTISPKMGKRSREIAKQFSLSKRIQSINGFVQQQLSS